MGIQPYGGRITLPASTKSVTQLLQQNTPTFSGKGVSVISARSKKGNSGTIYFVGNAAATADDSSTLGFIDAGEALTISTLSYNHTDKIFIIGTQNDVLYLYLFEN